ncbi:hypothetical protein ONA91_20985 [Micromonospora sp. DR5-3]|uniref:hypothetical protein n=1 Tax=unclassified Micromonospora TaxID=2617518 RepID=UPI0011D611C7|nr:MULTISPECIES: hypothetical protein [unclassified Micromonospora]MCW3816926.1 hypothetical protein [Micromonospora sp. DR5-3]TYC23422.1 hypothetical protein FXF52_15630 [Micromonospora sp. MP36]
MPETTRIRPSHDAVLPDDVTDPLLWRVAYDVAAAHRPDATGVCTSLLCVDQGAPCAPMVYARRAMRVARGGGQRPATRETPDPMASDQRRDAA